MVQLSCLSTWRAKTFSRLKAKSACVLFEQLKCEWKWCQYKEDVFKTDMIHHVSVFLLQKLLKHEETPSAWLPEIDTEQSPSPKAIQKGHVMWTKYNPYQF